jgi:hypothetical protein
MLEIQVSQRRPRQQSVQAWLRRCRSKARVILGRQDHHSVLAVHRHALWSEFPGLSHELAEMRFGVLKLPSWGQAMGGCGQLLGSARMSRVLPHCVAANLSRLVSSYTAAGSGIQDEGLATSHSFACAAALLPSTRCSSMSKAAGVRPERAATLPRVIEAHPEAVVGALRLRKAG